MSNTNATTWKCLIENHAKARLNLVDYATAVICHPLWLDHCYLSGNKSTDGQTLACCPRDKLRQGMQGARQLLGDRWGLTSHATIRSQVKRAHTVRPPTACAGVPIIIDPDRQPLNAHCHSIAPKYSSPDLISLFRGAQNLQSHGPLYSTHLFSHYVLFFSKSIF